MIHILADQVMHRACKENYGENFYQTILEISIGLPLFSWRVTAAQYQCWPLRGASLPRAPSLRGFNRQSGGPRKRGALMTYPDTPGRAARPSCEAASLKTLLAIPIKPDALPARMTPCGKV